MATTKEPSIELKLPDYDGEDRSDKVLEAIEKIDPSISDKWTPEGREEICMAIEKALTLLDPETAEFEISDIIKAADEQNMDWELNREVVATIEDDFIEEEFKDRELEKPLLSTDFNDYEFRRQVCDIFEVGYHTPSIDLIKLFTARIDKEWLIIF